MKPEEMNADEIQKLEDELIQQASDSVRLTSIEHDNSDGEDRS